MKVTVHHAVTGADYTNKPSRFGFSVTASSLPRRSFYDLCFTDPGPEGGVRVLEGRYVTQRQPEVRIFWAEAKVWPDDAPERRAARADSRDGFCRAHVTLWPSQEAANRLRGQVPFVDPLTLDPQLRAAPDLVVLDDDPCPHCNGTGTRKAEA